MQAANSMWWLLRVIKCLVMVIKSLWFLINAPLLVESEQDAERVLFSFGFGTSVPSTSRRRMQQRCVYVCLYSSVVCAFQVLAYSSLHVRLLFLF